MRALRKLFGRASSAPRPTVKPRLEALEDRLVPSTVASATHDRTFAIFRNELWEYNGLTGQLFPIRGNASQVSVGANGSLDLLGTDGFLYQSGVDNPWAWNTLWNGGGNIHTIAAGLYGSVLLTFGPNNDLWERYSNGGWNQIDTAVQDMSVTGDGTVWQVKTNGALGHLTRHWYGGAYYDTFDTFVNSGVSHVAAGPSNSVYITYGPNNHIWWMNSSGIWNPYDTFDSAAQLSVCIWDQNGGNSDFAVDYVTTSGLLSHAGTYTYDISWGAATS
jgi:hypothetical protein